MPSTVVAPILTPRFHDAFATAARVHADDTRKATRIPYLAHLMSVCGLVLSDGGDEDEAIAALLHDTLEDHPERITREEIADRFGPRVLRLVEICTDTPPGYTGGPKPEWRPRKEAYLAHVRRTPAPDLRVSIADKVDNARAIVLDCRELGDRLWGRFSAGKEEQLWYYRGLVAAYLAAGVRGPLLGELERAVAEMERLARRPASA